ncbi:hypothetical protein [Mycobacterium attenuatum]|nr:hypothetical protein [Mycobacterium attenuatum]
MTGKCSARVTVLLEVAGAAYYLALAWAATAAAERIVNHISQTAGTCP